MVSDFFKQLVDVAAKKKTEFRLQQEEVARKYDESLDCAVSNTMSKVEKYCDEQLSKFGAR